jgi:hypothetical protein
MYQKKNIAVDHSNTETIPLPKTKVSAIDLSAAVTGKPPLIRAYLS